MLTRPTPTRILHVLVATPGGGRGKGGIDRVMSTLRDELIREGDPGLDVGFAASRGLGHVGLSPLYAAGFILRMAALKAAGRLDLVHINLSVGASTYRKMAIASAARALRVPYVLHLHGSDYDTFWNSQRPFLRRRIRGLFEHAAQVIVLGQVWRDAVAKAAPAAAGRIAIIPNATEAPKRAHIGDGKSVHILFLGRLGERKGVPQLLEALSRLSDVPGWRATIAGDGEVEAMRSTVAKLGLQSRIAVPGWVDGEAVESLISTADVLALPSFAENLPVSVIEAMAAGLAVVATPVGAVEDIIRDGETGLLVAPGDVDALASAIGRLVSDPELRIRLGIAARTVHRTRLSPKPFAHAIIESWKNAVAGR